MNLPTVSRTQKGFTLIELLVVIAIIALLSAIVLSALGQSRIKAADAAIKSNLTNIRAEAGLYFETNGNSYNNLCGGAGPAADNVVAALDAQGRSLTTHDVRGEVCFDQGPAGVGGTQWAATVPLKSDDTKFFCVDVNGAARVTTGALVSTGDFNCSN